MAQEEFNKRGQNGCLGNGTVIMQLHVTGGHLRVIITRVTFV